MWFLDFWHLKKKIDRKQKNQKYAQVDKQTAISKNNKQTNKHRRKA